MTVGVISFSTGAAEGNARAPGALSALLKDRRLPVHAASAEQIHGDRVQIVPRLPVPRRFAQTDGLLTDVPRQPLAIYTADCIPFFLASDQSGVVGLLHVGWRGLRRRIAAKAVRLMRRRWRLKASSIQGWVGPSIGACCFEVRWDVARHFPATRRRKGDRWTVDLVGELRRQAKSLGIRWARKNTLEECTMHQSRWHSYRRDGTNQRQVSVIIKR